MGTLQVTLRSSEMGSLIRSYMRPLTFNLFKLSQPAFSNAFCTHFVV